MSEFDDRLRTAMHAVGDRAEVADLLNRSLLTSRVLRRRRAAAAVTAAAVVVGGIGAGGWAISAHSDRDGFSQVVTIPSSPAPTPTTPAPSSSPAPSTPAPSSPSPSAPAPSASSSVPPDAVSPSAVVSATPTSLTLEALPVVECPTVYGIDHPDPAGPVMSVIVPGPDWSQLANYTDGLHAMSVVGPRGWQCSAIDAADGNVSVFVAPPGTSSETSAGTGTKDLRQGIGAYLDGRSYELTCAAMPDLGLTGGSPCSKVPAGETFSRVDHTTADFVDPPGVAGIGTPSGGSYTARGQIRYSPRPIPTMGDLAAEVTCTLPGSDATLCQTIIDGFRPWVDPIGDPDAIQQCWRYYSSRNSAGSVVAGFDTTVGAANRYLDLMSGTPSQPPAVEHDAKHSSTTPTALCVFEGSYDVPGFVATRAYIIVGAGGKPLYPAVYDDQTSTPVRPAP